MDGKHTFARGQSITWAQNEQVSKNRELLLDLCRNNKLIPINTHFEKPQEQLATWAHPTTTKDDPIDRAHYDQLDYALIPHRWRNGILDAASEVRANIDSDHAPLLITTRFEYKQQMVKESTTQDKCKPMDCEKGEAYNKELVAELSQSPETSYDNLCQSLKKIVPRHFEPLKTSRQGLEWSELTTQLFQQRERERSEYNLVGGSDTNKLFRKSLKLDKTLHLPKSFRE